MKFLPFSLLSFFFIFLSTTNFAQPTGKFKKKLNKHNLEFFLPKGYVNAPIIQNPNLPNEFAITKGGEDFEIRYQIAPLKQELKAYKKNLKNPTVKLIHPNFLWKTGIRERISQLSLKAENPPELREFSEEAFNADFVGDGGGICFFPLSTDSNLGYKYAITMVIHRNFVADVYITFLGNDAEKLEEYSLEAFRAIRFKA
jgi:hypothetical protein